jgi:hypothetical protein
VTPLASHSHFGNFIFMQTDELVAACVQTKVLRRRGRPDNFATGKELVDLYYVSGVASATPELLV